MSDELPQDCSQAAEKVRSFPHRPGVYLMKDAAGRVIYVGKAKDLRSRAGSYFLKAAAEEQRTARLIQEIRDIDFLEAESEVDALLMEARLIKDIQPKFNHDLKDDKTFPYLEIHTDEDFPRIEFTREPSRRGTKLYGPFASAAGLRGAIQVLQKIFKFRTCSLDIEEGDERWRWFRPCLLASIGQCTAPCNLRVSREEYRKDIRRLQKFLDGKKQDLLTELRDEMAAAAKELRFEEAARLRDELRLLETLDDRGELDTHVQPEVFPIDPKKGLAGLQRLLDLENQPRVIEGVDIAHLQGAETVASLVQFIDGLPFKPGYKHYRIRHVEGVDDFASIHEVVARRFQRLAAEGEVFPDVLLIDGGKGQLHAAQAAFATLELRPPALVSLAKREEEVFVPGAGEPLRLARHSFALRLLQYVRDEAHRFAQHYHHILRRKSTLGEQHMPQPGEIEVELGVPIPGVILPPDQWAKTALKKLPPEGPLNFAAIFGRAAPLVLDLGCGNGRFLLASALRRPEFNHLGLDILPMVIRYATRRANQRGLHHVRLAVCGGHEFLDRYVAPHCVAEIHVYHPQPYGDAQKKERRLVTPEFLALVHRSLEPGGLFVVQTDNAAYWQYIARIAPRFFAFEEQKGPWPDMPEGRSRREIVARRAGLPIFRGFGRPRTDLAPDAIASLVQELPLPAFDAAIKKRGRRRRLH